MHIQASHPFPPAQAGALAARPRTNAWMAKGIGAVLIAAAALTLYGGLTAPA